MQMTAFLDKYATYSQFFEAYDQTLCQLSNTFFTDAEVVSKIEAYRKIIDDAVEKDSRKGFTFKEYELSLAALREFVLIRNNETRSFLKKKGYTCTTSSKQPKVMNSKIRVFPNPAKNYLSINISETTPCNYSISNLQGVLLQKGTVENSPINISTLPKGLFIFEIFQSGKRIAVMKVMKN